MIGIFLSASCSGCTSPSGSGSARPTPVLSTRAALRRLVGLSILIELASCVFAASAWVVGVVVT